MVRCLVRATTGFGLLLTHYMIDMFHEHCFLTAEIRFIAATGLPLVLFVSDIRQEALIVRYTCLQRPDSGLDEQPELFC
jgi:hypothetical protein